MNQIENTGKCYQEIIDITKNCFESELETERFVSRQIKLHLKKTPDDLSRKDLPILAVRIRSGLLVITKNAQLVEEIFRKILAVPDC